MQLKDLTTDDVRKVLRPIWNGKPSTASKLRGRIELVLDYARVIEKRAGGDNPARWRGHLNKLLPAPNKVKVSRHFPPLPFNEVGAFMAELRQRQGLDAKALQFTILSCARTNEVVGAKWAEIDLERRLWTILASRMTSGQDHTKALPVAARELFRRLPSIREFLFPQQT